MQAWNSCSAANACCAGCTCVGSMCHPSDPGQGKCGGGAPTPPVAPTPSPPTPSAPTPAVPTPAVPTPAPGPPGNLTEPFFASYWETWGGAQLGSPIHQKADILNIAFAQPSGTAATLPVTKAAVAALQQTGTKVAVSYGGCSYRQMWKAVLDDATQRSQLVTAIVQTVTNYGLDGVDLDIECGDDTQDTQQQPAQAESVIAFFKELRTKIDAAGSAAGKKLTISYTVLTPSALFDTEVTGSHPFVDYVQVMAYNPYINPQKPGTEWPKPAKCEPTSPDPMPYDAIADLDRYPTKLGVPKSKLVFGLMPGCSDHNRCTSAADVQNRSAHVKEHGYAGVMTWDVDRDREAITGYSGSVSDVILSALGRGDEDVVDLPTTCPENPPPTGARVAFS